jgi:hypothetical protein
MAHLLEGTKATLRTIWSLGVEILVLLSELTLIFGFIFTPVKVYIGRDDDDDDDD